MQKMINFDHVITEEKKEHNLNWPENRDHLEYTEY